MTRMNKLIRCACLITGFVSVGFFVFSFFILSIIKPKMIAFQVISPLEEGSLNWIGVGITLVFYSLSVLRTANYSKRASEITHLSIIQIVVGVISFISIFADFALLGDIVKQYQHGFSQPEWALVLPIMVFQLLSLLFFLTLHLFGFKDKDQVGQVAFDSNIFIIVQLVGVLCGLGGLALSSLGYLYPKAWRLDIHTTMTLIILLIPYLLGAGYWFINKLQEKNRQFYDEKQIQDVGRSAFFTLILNVLLMTGLFLTNYSNLGGVTSISWLPIHLFSILLFFSLGNIYFTRRGI